ncbi:hypothetical protein KIK06_16695 [Nocardiopsis sp. EMB25]|uniref:hypothetical protein n=1 Tax=Nocardiopsis sp. EMB25 TaxID=2835867 RepID=UPI00228461CE|nr:hypothetical protein [Nocardiopsis sp. EMB25]MCY9785526.1 hypothetical protein [Nocardiopsis sp. EMB25]
MASPGPAAPSKKPVPRDSGPVLIRQVRQTALPVAAAVAVGIGSAAATTGVLAHQDRPREISGTSAAISYRKPGSTARDWVTYADHVILARVVSERTVPPPHEDPEPGVGVGRNVTLDVRRVLWSADDPPRPVPEIFEYSTWGYTLTGGLENHRPSGVGDQPRLEAGHQYVMAIDWEDERCSPGDERQPGMWMGLDNNSAVPADDGVVGNGELGGRVTDARERGRSPRFADEGPNPTVQGRMMGEDVDALARELAATAPDPAPGDHDLDPAPCD